MAIDEPVQFKVLVVVTERVDQLFSHLEQTHEEEELEDGEDGNVEVDVERDPSAGHSAIRHRVRVQLLPADDGEDEEDVGGQGHHLGVDHGDGDPVVAPEQSALGSELTELLRREIINLRVQC